MADIIKALKKKRGGVKRSLTQLKKFIDDLILNKDSVDLKKNEFLLKQKFPLISESETKYKTIYEELIEEVSTQDDESIDAVEDDFMEFQSSLAEVRYLFHTQMNVFEESHKASDAIASAGSVHTNGDEESQVESALQLQHPTSTKIETSVSENNILGETRPTISITDGEHLKLDVGDKNPTLNAVSLKEMVVMKTSDTFSRSHDPNVNLIQSRRSDDLQYGSIRLPQITLPTFDGNIQNWLGFRDSFNDLIVVNPTISDIQRYYYLDGALVGDAKRTIANIEFSSHGFELAWEALISKYDDRKFIIENHFHSFFNLKSMSRECRNDITRLLDETQKHLRALDKLGQRLSDAVVVFIVKQRFDPETRKLWENEDTGNDFPTWQQMVEFLQRRCRALNIVGEVSKTSFTNSRRPISKNFALSIAPGTNSPNSCYICKNTHVVSACPQFSSMTPQQSYDKTKQLGLCIKCLRGRHKVFQCRGPPCNKCHRNHHVLLHLENINLPSTSSNEVSSHIITNSSPKEKAADPKEASTSLFCKEPNINQTILPTALILVADSSGIYHPCRALLDSASQSNFITGSLADRLSLSGQDMTTSIRGLNQLTTNSSQKINASIKSRNRAFISQFDFLVVPSIACNLPNFSFSTTHWNLPPNLKLADPNFYVSGHIDMLLGAEVFYKILVNGQLKLSDNLPILQKTVFGWVIGGRVEENANFFLCSEELQSENDSKLHKLIEKFWVIESVESTPKLSLEEKECERIFQETYKRDSSGRFVVHLPIKETSIDSLGESKNQALKRFYYLESKFRKNEKLKAQYVKFMTEYETLGHMKVCEPNQTSVEYFLPHHAVMKDDKIRVVFDASAKTSTNISLNDVLMIGPVVQKDLFSIILNFRKFQYVFTTDIEKMYRQIMIDPDHRPLQKILWRKSENEPIREYQLQTVTYGTSSAPYLATKSLVQLAKLESKKYPLASRATLDHFYVDDLLAGTNDVGDALKLQSELIEMLKGAGMTLRKWSANCKELLTFIPEEDRAHKDGSNETIKTLGLIWNSSTDHFKFRTSSIQCKSPSTKREVLSNIAKLFDPLGLIAPVIVTAKILMQQIWICKLEWDDFLPPHIQSAWDKFCQQLPTVNDIVLERQIISPGAQSIEIHGFADASNVAYGACIYVRSIDATGQIYMKLVCSKSRVAPLNTTSIPRLELNAALLLSRLVKKVSESLNLTLTRILLWSDSSIVLSWLKMPPYQLKTYVANRVSEIRELTVNMFWRHVDTKNNAADILSRGVLPAELVNYPHWLSGPPFLCSSEDKWPKKFVAKTKVPEMKEKTLVFMAVEIKPFKDVLNIEKYSLLSRLIRKIAWCRRIFYFHVTKDKSSVNVGTFDPAELNEATKCALRIVQRAKFSTELRQLESKSQLNENNPILRLNPFIDDEKLLRVGGRLTNSKTLSTDAKHQILLSDHHITRLLIQRVHVANLHCGIQQPLSTLRQSYWLIHGKGLVKKNLHLCLPCYKTKPKLMSQIMGNLPQSRKETCRPFYITGIDFCGPFSVRYRNMRKPTYDKVYISIFVCFTTKAVHLDIVEDASADAFMACLKRFFSRRGKSHQIWSDNGTNFVGAHNQLVQLEKMFIEKQRDIIEFCSYEGIKWNFIPPRAPHFGGIWESGVKVIKTHLKKVVGCAVLTLELLHTLVVQIEGVMNSRPISEMSSDPNDLEPLTPGHFLIGTAINTIIEPDVTQIPSSRLTQWQKITQMVQVYWKRFYLEYINTLQQRNKWKREQPNLKISEVVIVKEDNMPSTHWLVGRIEEIIRGKDGNIRCAIVRTKHGSYKRPITKLARLPKDLNLPPQISTTEKG